MALDTSIDEHVKQVLNKYKNIRLAIIFGSMARGNFNQNSDLDIAIAADHVLESQEKMCLIEALALSISRPVDLIDLSTVGEPLLGQIITGGRRILGSNFCYAELLKKHLFNQADFMPYQRRILEERRRAWIGL